MIAVFSFLGLMFLGTSVEAVFKPKSMYVEEVVEEMGQYKLKEAEKSLNLQDKPLLFAAEDQLFEATEVKKLLSALERWPNLENLDLSLNRLPTEALPCFVGLLEKSNFKYLDVTVNSGADSVEGVRAVSEVLGGEKDMRRSEQVPILKKIIWVQESFLETAKERGILSQAYYDAHKAYYDSKKICSQDWSFPEEDPVKEALNRISKADSEEKKAGYSALILTARDSAKSITDRERAVQGIIMYGTDEQKEEVIPIIIGMVRDSLHRIGASVLGAGTPEEKNERLLTMLQNSSTPITDRALIALGVMFAVFSAFL